MQDYKVYPVFEADKSITVQASSDLEAACKYLMDKPVNKDLFVERGVGAASRVKIADVLAAYPELAKLVPLPVGVPVSSAEAAAAAMKEIAAESDSNEYSKIGGWLWVAAIGLGWSLVANAQASYTTWGLLNDPNLPNAEASYPGITALCTFEVAASVALTVLCAVMIPFFFMKKSFVRPMMIFMYVAYLATMVTDSLWCSNLGFQMESSDMVEAVRSGIIDVIWIVYFCVSERVRMTFVK